MADSRFSVVSGSLLESNCKYIAHQTNCVSDHAAHLAASIFKKYPHADVYSARAGNAYRDTPGTIIVRGEGDRQRYVVAMMAQIFPGRPKSQNSGADGFPARKKYFHQCLKSIALIDELDSIAFPYGIGCGAAGGNWVWYKAILDKFATHIAPKAKVVLYKLSDDITQTYKG